MRHRVADAMRHEPCRAVGDAERALQFEGGDAVLARAHHVDTEYPFRERNLAVLEDRANEDGKLLATLVALPDAAIAYLAGACRAMAVLGSKERRLSHDATMG